MARPTLDERLRKAEGRFKEMRAKKSKQRREERTGQLVSLGILVEQAFSKLSPGAKAELKTAASALDERNKGRAFAAFERIASAHAQAVPPTPVAQVKTQTQTPPTPVAPHVQQTQQTPASAVPAPTVEQKYPAQITCPKCGKKLDLNQSQAPVKPYFICDKSCGYYAPAEALKSERAQEQSAHGHP